MAVRPDSRSHRKFDVVHTPDPGTLQVASHHVAGPNLVCLHGIWPADQGDNNIYDCDFGSRFLYAMGHAA